MNFNIPETIKLLLSVEDSQNTKQVQELLRYINDPNLSFSHGKNTIYIHNKHPEAKLYRFYSSTSATADIALSYFYPGFSLEQDYSPQIHPEAIAITEFLFSNNTQLASNQRILELLDHKIDNISLAKFLLENPHLISKYLLLQIQNHLILK